ncbi:hypothetical protein [Hydrocarboniphaga sp.]|uniref:hypothetical protein n=1 Tax=Hydrocarboniphaga sp. TaxID=2033016 RepID=UPI003D0F8659
MRLTLSLSLLLAITACTPTAAPEAEAPVTQAASVDDVPSFDAFIAGKPTPQDFRKRYPAVLLVLPGDIATRELRMDRSRYFAELDEQQRISGGKFQ